MRKILTTIFLSALILVGTFSVLTPTPTYAEEVNERTDCDEIKTTNEGSGMHRSLQSSCYQINKAIGVANRGGLSADALAKIKQEITWMNQEFDRVKGESANWPAGQLNPAQQAKVNALNDFINYKLQQVFIHAGKTEAEAAQEAKAAELCSGAGGLEALANPLDCLMIPVTRGILYAIVAVAGKVLWVVGMLFDKTLEYTVLEMAERVNQLSAVAYGWMVFRDLANMVFIFILLYIAIQTIIGNDKTPVKKLIVNVVIVGLLLNFSMFVVKFLVDGSNILSVAFYNQIVPPGESLSFAVAEPMGLKMAVGNEAFQSVVTETAAATLMDQLTSLAIWAIGSIFFFLTVSFTFLYASVLFIIRFMVILFTMIVAPLAAVAYILPNTRDKFNQWWKMLLGQLVFAPLYMLLIYVAIRFQRSLLGNDQQLQIQEIFSGGAMENLLKFILTIGFLIFAGILATKWAASSGGVVETAVNRVNDAIGVRRMKRSLTAVPSAVTGTGKYIGGGIKATGGALTRTTVGKYAAGRLLKKGDELRDKALTGTVAQKASARIQLAALEKVSAGRKVQVDERAKEHIERAKKYGSASEETRKKLKDAFSATGDANKAYTQAYNKAVSENKNPNTDSEVLAKRQDLRDKLDAMNRLKRKAQRERQAQQAVYINNLAGQKKPYGKDARKRAVVLFAEQTKLPSVAEERTDKIDEIADRITNDPSVAKRELANLEASEIRNLPGEVLVRPEVMANLDAGDFEVIRRAGRLTKEQKKQVADYLSKPEHERASTGSREKLLWDHYNKNRGSYPSDSTSPESTPPDYSI